MKAILSKFFKDSAFAVKFKEINVHILIGCLLLFIILHTTYALTIFSYPYDYKVGDIVSEDIVLSEDYHDLEATSALKENVKYEVDEIFTIDPKVYSDAKTSIGEFYNKAYDIRAEYTEEVEIRERVFSYLLRGSFGLNEEELKALSSMEDVDLRLTENYSYDILKNILRSEVTDENIISKKQEVTDYFNAIEQIDEAVKPIIEKIVQFHVVHNSHLDEAATQAAIENAQNLVEGVVIPAGTILVSSGQALDEKNYRIINELGLNDLHTFEQNIPLLSMDVLVILMLFLMYFVVRFYSHRYKKSIMQVYLNFSILILVYLLSFGLKSLSVYIMPLASIGMLIAIVDDFSSGIIYSFFATVIFSVIFSVPVSLAAMVILGCMISAIMVSGVHQRGRIFLAGLTVSVINAIMIVTYLLISGSQSGYIIESMLLGMLSGVLCSVLTIGSLPIWETVFRVLTPLRLLELSNPNHPLMKKLLLEAPGTYHHSIMVANLSEAAVHDIGGNAIMARVGAYFHDVGKIERPFFYVENQFDNNPHDQLVPMVSAKIIKEHVEKGLELGRKYKLPNEILAFIEEHHGTTMIKYFYHKASENLEEGVEIDPGAYTYDGPSPTSKETAVVMLADSVEAAVRSLKQGDVKALISKIIDDKIKSHQLDNSGLTFGDVEVIKQSFYSNLSSAFHERIEYPQEKTHINVIK
ncbi:HDIG domain-containing protein [Acidaminobacter sp. JC074]|uniref:HD family phosphohydrolase n=1 Tax=Acidaminobacter sp. JC074 TaxID=2530199 RepID=UPI001F100E44|nr:HDIG domain-containing metalloprotein [Acidaminobacter sp. JC074]MCH4887716.1 HDIG domain-containing protein [Acidaminobacter sp. JC074]